MLLRTALLACVLLAPAAAELRLNVTVTERKTGRAVADLKASDFTLLEDKTGGRSRRHSISRARSTPCC